MTISRQHFRIVTDTGDGTGTQAAIDLAATKGDTGPSTVGRVVMVRYKQEGNDTGGDLEIGAYPAIDTGDFFPGNTIADTGQGYLFYQRVAGLGGDTGGVDVRFAPVVPISKTITDVSDTGHEPLVLGGERIRVKVRGGRVVKAGSTNLTNVWVYVSDD